VPYLIKSYMDENTLMIGTDCGLVGRWAKPFLVPVFS
jgi:hypothetical protein